MSGRGRQASSANGTLAMVITERERNTHTLATCYIHSSPLHVPVRAPLVTETLSHVTPAAATPQDHVQPHQALGEQEVVGGSGVEWRWKEPSHFPSHTHKHALLLLLETDVHTRAKGLQTRHPRCRRARTCVRKGSRPCPVCIHCCTTQTRTHRLGYHEEENARTMERVCSHCVCACACACVFRCKKENDVNG